MTSHAERSLTELLQAAQHMNTKADLALGSLGIDGTFKLPAASIATPDYGGTPAVSMEVSADDLPRVDRSLAQLVQVGEALWPGRGGREAGKLPSDHEAQASILLGSRGLDLPHMSTRLTSLATAPDTVPDFTAPAVPGVGGFDASQPTTMAAFLRTHRQNAIVAALHAANLQTGSEVQDAYWQQQRCEWEQAKQTLLAAFTTTDNDLLSVTLPTQGRLRDAAGVVDSTTTGGGLDSEELQYAAVLQEYNRQVLCHGVLPSLAQNMHRVAQNMQDQGVADLWRAVVCMSGVSGSLGVGGGGEAAGAGGGPLRTKARVMTAVVTQARTLLQEKYAEHMRAMVYSDLARAGLGGVPGLCGLVKGYLGVCLPQSLSPHLEDGSGSNGAPVWPLLYYCLRAGGLREAAMAAPDNSSPPVVEVTAALHQCLRSDDHRLPPDSEKRLRLSYKRSVKSMRDPFKRAVYCVLARCDVTEDHCDVVTTTDDYLWLKLTLCDTSSDCTVAGAVPSTPTAGPSSAAATSGSKHDVLTLPQLQHMLYKQYGETHFNAHEQPLLYTTVLLLTGQFEAAVEFLRRSDRLLCHAVHVAIALHTAGILCAPQDISAPLLSRESGDPECCLRLNLSRLLLLYTRRFESTHPEHALHYCFLLRGLKTSAGEDVFLNCISSLALHCREFDLLLGRLREDGTRLPGIVDTFNVDVREVTELVARDSERKGLHEDAVRLYDLAKNNEKVICLLNKLLAQVVHLTSPNITPAAITTSLNATAAPVTSSGSDRERVLELACSIALRYRQHGHAAAPHTAATLHLLLDLATVFDLYHSRRYQETMEVIGRLQLIALTRTEVEPRVAGLAAVAPEVKDVLPSLLLAAITATHHIYTTAFSTSGAPASTGDASTKHLQQQARAIVTFAGMIPLRLHADVNARLVQLEALIN